MESIFDRCLLSAREMIKNLIKIELGHINTDHPEFVDGTELFMNIMTRGEKKEEEQEPVMNGIMEVGNLMLDKHKKEKEPIEPENNLKIKE